MREQVRECVEISSDSDSNGADLVGHVVSAKAPDAASVVKSKGAGNKRDAAGSTFAPPRTESPVKRGACILDLQFFADLYETCFISGKRHTLPSGNVEMRDTRQSAGG